MDGRVTTQVTTQCCKIHLSSRVAGQEIGQVAMSERDAVAMLAVALAPICARPAPNLSHVAHDPHCTCGVFRAAKGEWRPLEFLVETASL